MPFRISFHSDSYEMSAAAMDEGTGANTGFKLRFVYIFGFKTIDLNYVVSFLGTFKLDVDS